MRFPVVIILAGGANSRFWPLEQKSLFSFLGEPLLTQHVRLLRELGCQDFVVIANPDNAGAVEKVLSEIPGIQAHTVVQPQPNGMADAILCAETCLRERFPARGIYVTQVHDVTDNALHKAMLEAAQTGEAYGYIPGHHVESYFNGGYLVLDGRKVLGIVEKPSKGNEPSNVIKVVADYFTDWRNFAATLKDLAESGGDDIYEKALTNLCQRHLIEVVYHEQGIHTIKYPWHVLDVMDFFLSRDFVQARIKSMGVAENQLPFVAQDVDVPVSASITGVTYVGEGAILSPGVIIQGPAFIGPGVRLAARTTVIGPACLEEGVRMFPGATISGSVYVEKEAKIGNNALVRGSYIGAGSDVGFSTEVARSYIGPNCELHTNYVGDSVLAEGVHMGSGAVTANLKLNNRTVSASPGRGQAVDTGRLKLGMIAGPYAQVGINASIMPGKQLGRNSVVGAGVMLDRDLGDNRFLRVRWNAEGMGQLVETDANLRRSDSTDTNVKK